jgi:hypothetical protein
MLVWPVLFLLCVRAFIVVMCCALVLVGLGDVGGVVELHRSARKIVSYTCRSVWDVWVCVKQVSLWNTEEKV